MKEPVLVIMAAGMGSRFGGLKQLTAVDSQGHVIMDFALFDAARAGFKKVVFIIKEDFASEFRQRIGKRVEPFFEKVDYVYQDVSMLPEGFAVPDGRTKPWGTAHAVLCAADAVDGPMAVINADDYYGPEAFRKIYDFLTKRSEDEAAGCKMHFAMVAYRLAHTLTENGTVSRGVCTVGDDGLLQGICEREKIKRRPEGICYFDNEKDAWISIPGDTPVSMNMWGFCDGFLAFLADGFPRFLSGLTKENMQKAEYYLPAAVWEMVSADKADVTVLTSDDKWFGVTYKEDRQMVEDTVRSLKERGLYPASLWEER